MTDHFHGDTQDLDTFLGKDAKKDTIVGGENFGSVSPRRSPLGFSREGKLVKVVDGGKNENDPLAMIFLSKEDRGIILSQLEKMGKEIGMELSLDNDNKICDSEGQPVSEEIKQTVLSRLKF